jgi:AmmeMemoRadiSam system protein A
MFSKHLRPLLDNRTLVLVSSDFTHFGPHFEYVPRFEDVPRGIEALDRRVFDRFAAGDLDGFWQVLEETGATVCGRVAIAVLMGMLPRAATVEEIAYETSGRLLGDWENSVSYFGALVHGAWTPLKRAPAGAAGESDETELLSSADRGLLLRLARATLEQVVRSGQLPPLEETGVTLTPGLERVRGGFVTLHVDGELRGCIGEIFARRPIWEVVREQTANAACNDPRFMAVTPRETSAIRIEISVLSPTRPVASFRDIVIGRHGMVMHKSGRSAVFLPQVAEEQGWDLETTLSYLARKAGLHADAWREGADFQVFEADVFNE